MIIVRKKTLISLLIICFGFMIVLSSMENTEEVVALPVNEKTIILDAGHGGEDGGAVSNNGVEEADINLNIVLKLQKLLEQSGACVILTRSTDESIYDLNSSSIRSKKVSDLKNRVKIGNESSADIFVSIHLNKIPQAQYYGWQTFYGKDDEQGKKLSECIQENLNLAIQKENKRVSKTISNIYIIDKVEIPTTIVECGFLSNPEEENNLQNDEYQEKLAWGIYTGIMDYFNN